MSPHPVSPWRDQVKHAAPDRKTSRFVFERFVPIITFIAALVVMKRAATSHQQLQEIPDDDELED